MKTVAKLIFDLSIELNESPYDIIGCLAGMVISEEQESEIIELISNRDF